MLYSIRYSLYIEYVNLDDAFTLEKRAYNDSMEGIIAASSTTGGNIGVNRTLTYNANITSNRGYLRAGNLENTTDLNMGNLLSVSEMSAPLVATHDSSMRVNMITAQSKQSIPIAKTNRRLITNGSELAISHVISNDFVFIAEDDGIVTEYDEKNELMILTYKNGHTATINLAPNIVKNGGGGFYINNQLSTNLIVGDKFTKGQVLAKNDNYFKDTIDKKDVEFSMRKLAKIGIYAGDFTHEDSSLVTNKLCEEMSTNITMRKSKVLSMTSNVDYIAKKGQEIKTGEPLLIFEQGYDEAEVNSMLSKIADELHEEITRLSKNQLLSKYTGRIDDIKIYYTCKIEDMSPSLQKIVKSYNSTILSKEKLLNKYYSNINDSNIILDPHEQIDAKNGKVKGTTMVDAVMIEFYITYHDKMNVGDKLSYSTALKSIISRVCEDNEAPYSELHKDEPIDALMSYISVNARMCTSIYLELYCNKVLLELKNAVAELWK